MSAENKRLTIKDAAEMLQVSVDTLRRWDKEGLLSPAGRTVSGWRYYLFTDISLMLDDMAHAHCRSKMKAKAVLLAEAAEKILKENRQTSGSLNELPCLDDTSLLEDARSLVDAVQHHDKERVLALIASITKKISDFA